MFVNRSGWNEQSLSRTFHRCILPSFGSFGQAVSEIFKNRPIRNKNCLWRPCLLTDLAVRRPLTFHILIFSSETSQPNELKLDKKHLFKVLGLQMYNILYGFGLQIYKIYLALDSKSTTRYLKLMSPLNAAICTTTYLERQKCYGPGKKILFKKQLFDLEVNIQNIVHL
jgi:hypothetical protein